MPRLLERCPSHARTAQLLAKHACPSFDKQDVGFYDTTKTGEITSRLSADTTTVSDQICLNLNVMLRSATQVRAAGASRSCSIWSQGAAELLHVSCRKPAPLRQAI